MKRSIKVMLSTIAIGAVSLFGVFGASCSAVDWVEEKINQLKCPHEYTDTVDAVAPTCTEDGHSQYKVCIDCGYEVTPKKVEKATGHKTKVIKGTPATCTEMGLSDAEECEVCGEIVVEHKDIPALGHNRVELPAVAPTCTETGLTAGIACDREGCGIVLVEQSVLEMVEHRYYKGECRDCGAIQYKFEDESTFTKTLVQGGDNLVGKTVRIMAKDYVAHNPYVLVVGDTGYGFAVENTDDGLKLVVSDGADHSYAQATNVFPDYYVGDGYIDITFDVGDLLYDGSPQDVNFSLSEETEFFIMDGSSLDIIDVQTKDMNFAYILTPKA